MSLPVEITEDSLQLLCQQDVLFEYAGGKSVSAIAAAQCLTPAQVRSQIAAGQRLFATHRDALSRQMSVLDALRLERLVEELTKYAVTLTAKAAADAEAGAQDGATQVPLHVFDPISDLMRLKGELLGAGGGIARSVSAPPVSVNILQQLSGQYKDASSVASMPGLAVDASEAIINAHRGDG